MISAAAARIKTITTNNQTNPMPHIIPGIILSIIGSPQTSRRVQLLEGYLQAARFMHMSIMKVHGRDAMMRNISAPVSQFQFQATLKETAVAKTRYSAIQ
ncbi:MULTISPECIES: hypothetical protein [unclassified Bradyrhizobium]|uniref:hypothetical protein n=1 Tax=unclassified Bradyrhizobium TaxID=2631580 RepID=UPI002FEF6173